MQRSQMARQPAALAFARVQAASAISIQHRVYRTAIDFTNAQLVFSVDVSGSTLGKILRKECAAIEAIRGATRNLTASAKHFPITPWAGSAGQVITTASTGQLRSGGGTDPNCLLQGAPLESIQKANIWVLLTDGEIGNDLIKNFAEALPNKSLHAKPCVIVLVGPRKRRPNDCNISVGISLYAIVPSCIFLFHDTSNDQVYILQSKGCFDVLLGDKAASRPSLDANTKWDDLPKMKYEDFARVRIVQYSGVSRTEIVLQSGILVDFGLLLAGRLDPRITETVISQRADLNQLAQTAASRQQLSEFTAWASRELQRRKDRQESLRSSLQAGPSGRGGGQIALVPRPIGNRPRVPPPSRPSLPASLAQSQQSGLQLRTSHAENLEAAIARASLINRVGLRNPIVLMELRVRKM